MLYILNLMVFGYVMYFKPYGYVMHFKPYGYVMHFKCHYRMTWHQSIALSNCIWSTLCTSFLH